MNQEIPSSDLDRRGLVSDEKLDFVDSARGTLELIIRKRKIFIWVAVISVLLAAADHTFFPSYKVDVTLFFDSQNGNNGLRALLGNLEMERGSAPDEIDDQKYLLTLQSHSFRKRYRQILLNDPQFESFRSDLNKPSNIFRAIPVLFETLSKGKKPTSGDDSGIDRAIRPVKLAFTKKGILGAQFASPNPMLAVFLANHFTEAAIQTFTKNEEAKIDVARGYINKKISETVSKMEESDKKIVGVTTKNAKVSLLAPQSAIAEQLLDMRAQIQKTKFALQQNTQLIRSLKERRAEADSTKGSSAYAPPALDPALLEHVPTSMAGVGKTLRNLETENQLLAIQSETLTEGLNDLLKSNLSLTKDEQLLADLKRTRGLDFYIFDNLIKTLLQVEVRGLSMSQRVYSLETVEPVQSEVSISLTKEVLLSLIVAIFLTSILIYASDYVNPAIRSKREVDGFDIHHLGNIPLVHSLYFENERKYRFLCQFNVDSKETAPFKQIRSRLFYLSKHSGTKRRQVISCLSYGNNEGKSFFSSNLAACIAKSGARTLLMDFDLRRGATSKNFLLEGAKGLCTFLDGKETLEGVTVKNLLPSLDFVPAGAWATAITENFSNERFNQILDSVRDKYDYIVLDTAPLAVAHESLAIAQDADLLILMVSAWHTKREALRTAFEEIRAVRKTAPIHFVLNRAKEVNSQMVSNYYYFGRYFTQIQRKLAEA